MAIDVPICKRCCFCIPLRYGLLAWGYLRVILSCILMIAMCISKDILFDDPKNIKIVTYIIVTCIISIVLIINISFNIVLIVGCHKKKAKLLKVYFIYSVVLCVIMTVYGSKKIISITKAISDVYSNNETLPQEVWMNVGLEFAMLLTELILQIYIIILVKSEMVKLRDNTQNQIKNNTPEPESTFTVVDVDKLEREHYYVLDEKNI